MTANDLIAAFEVLAEAPDGVKRLRGLVLQLAMRGRLVRQYPSEGRVAPSATPVGLDEAPFELPEGWQWLRLPEVADYAVGKTPATKEPRYWGASEIPWVSIGDMPDGGVVTSTARTVTADAAKEVFRRPPATAGTLLMSFKLTIGKMAILGVDAYHNEAIISLAPNKRTSRDYLLRVLPSMALGGESKDAIMGATLNGQSLARVLVPLPPLPEQHRIVARVDELMGLLDRLEAARTARDALRRAARDAALAALRDAEDSDAVEAAWGRIVGHTDALLTDPHDVEPLRHAVLQLAVRGRLVPQDLTDESAGRVLERLAKARGVGVGTLVPMEDDEPLLFPIPKGWTWTTVGALGQDGEQSVADGPFGSKLKSEHYVAEPGFRVLRLGNVGRGVFKNADRSYISEDYGATLSAYHLRDGDILVASLGDPPGRACLVPKSVLPALNKADCFRVRPTNEVVGPFVTLALNAPFGAARSLALHRGDTRGRINLSHLRSMPVPLPPLNEQRRILAKVDNLMAICDDLEARLTAARDLHEQFAAAAVHHLDL